MHRDKKTKLCKTKTTKFHSNLYLSFAASCFNCWNCLYKSIQKSPEKMPLWGTLNVQNKISPWKIYTSVLKHKEVLKCGWIINILFPSGTCSQCKNYKEQKYTKTLLELTIMNKAEQNWELKFLWKERKRKCWKNSSLFKKSR